MKYVYIAGLEHSGTTLVNHLMSAYPDVLGLGEVASFFSTGHMKNYMRRWGKYPDARLCSCGETWEGCDFWGAISGLNGLNSDRPLVDKYSELVRHVKSGYPPGQIIVDSSKGAPSLHALLESADQIGIRRDDVSVVLAVKDVRNFTASIAKKAESARSLLAHWKTFNWWLGTNRRFLSYLEGAGISFDLVLYEELCADPDQVLGRVLKKLGVDLNADIAVKHNRSHIAMGNKNFVMRNRDRIRYDYRWFLEDGVSLTYLLHGRARKFNKKLYGR
jgi:hypothetical protein